eukprot:223-Pleurochrysis_carterae.AAC.1
MEVDTPAPAAVQPDAPAEVTTETPAPAAEQPAAPAVAAETETETPSQDEVQLDDQAETSMD